MGLKQSLKQILVKKQHRKYETELSKKKMSYHDWITKQEIQVKVDDAIVCKKAKCQTNEKDDLLYDGLQNENEGIHSENDGKVQNWEIFSKSDASAPVMRLMEIPYSLTASGKVEKYLHFLSKMKADVILFRQEEGEMSSFSLALLYQKFCENENIILIYGDEDVIERKDGTAERMNPWFKPDWSPDTFLSSFYFGSLVAVRAEAAREALGGLVSEEIKTLRAEGKEEVGNFLYDLCKEVIKRANGFSCHDGLFREVPVCHIPEVLIHTQKTGYEMIREWKLSDRESVWEDSDEKKPLISVIIPSKDNPKVLFTCIYSFLEKTKTAYPFEILVIDNGSDEENKQQIAAEAVRISEAPESANASLQRICYHHQPMVFNFSKMCNLGASLAKGELLLFLNDDMEIVQEDWLTLLADKAVLSYVGAVGAKLLYPDSDVMQHAGITNLRVGPAHKLQFLSDTVNHYYGRNRGVHDMLAVTGACLLVKREVFESVGGFEKDLAVAFNDVDLCYHIYEAGYYNVQRNDVILYHHESLSRGKDGESEEKQQRLLREKDVLYVRHQEIYGKDPFYHKYLTTDMLESEYSPAVRYQVTLDMPWAEVRQEQKLKENIREDGCVVIGMEAAMDLYKWKYGVAPGRGKKEPLPEEMGYYFQGYSFVIGSDNACYKKTLILENKENEQVIYVPLDIRYRPDIRKNLKDQLNVDLTGYAAKVKLADIPKGEYRFGMLAEDKCSRLKLVNWSSWTFSV